MSITIAQVIQEYQNLGRDKNAVFMPLDNDNLFLLMNQELKALNDELEYSFTRTSVTITTVVGTQFYDLTLGFQSLEGQFNLTRDSDGIILQPTTETEAKLYMQGIPSAQGTPNMYFIRLKPGGTQIYQIGFVLIPSQVQTYTLVGKFEPTEITTATTLTGYFPIPSPWHKTIVYRLLQLTFEMRKDFALAQYFGQQYETWHRRTCHHYSQAGLNPGFVPYIDESFNRARIGGQNRYNDIKPSSLYPFGRVW